jgi:F-type H+-transporting ATPase subunit delta
VDEKIAVVTALGSRLGCPVIGQTFLGQLVKKNRVGYLPEIANAFGKLVDAAKGMQHVTVASATTLPQPEQERVKKRLREMLKRDVDVTFQSDPQYLAGLQITIGSTVVDSTIRGRLDAMRTVLTRE